MSNELIKKPAFKIGAPIGLAARKKAALATATENGEVITQKPNEMPERIGIVFDDSGSMFGSLMTNAHAGVEEFLRSCNPRTTAVAVYPMNEKAMPLTTGLAVLSSLVTKLGPTGSTPLVETLESMLVKENITRAIVFSDGCPDSSNTSTVVPTCRERKVPVDTVYIGSGDSKFLEKLAKDTGGIYLVFSGDKSNFRTAFKYLSPGYRAMLADKSFVDKLQNGQV